MPWSHLLSGVERALARSFHDFVTVIFQVCRLAEAMSRPPVVEEVDRQTYGPFQ